MATIKQIAEMAGVSRGTVDRVLNNRGSVNANTAARVREIAEKLKMFDGDPVDEYYFKETVDEEYKQIMIKNHIKTIKI